MNGVDPTKQCRSSQRLGGIDTIPTSPSLSQDKIAKEEPESQPKPAEKTPEQKAAERAARAQKEAKFLADLELKREKASKWSQQAANNNGAPLLLPGGHRDLQNPVPWEVPMIIQPSRSNNSHFPEHTQEHARVLGLLASITAELETVTQVSRVLWWHCRTNDMMC